MFNNVIILFYSSFVLKRICLNVIVFSISDDGQNKLRRRGRDERSTDEIKNLKTCTEESTCTDY